MTYDGHEQYWYYWKGFQLGKSNHVAKTGREGEFQGGKNDMFNFKFQKTPVELFGRIRYHEKSLTQSL